MLGQEISLNSNLSQSVTPIIRTTDRDIWAAVFLICWCACWVHLTGDAGLPFVWAAAAGAITTKFTPRLGPLLGAGLVCTLLAITPAITEVYPYSASALLFLLVNFPLTLAWPTAESAPPQAAEPTPTDPSVWEQSLLQDRGTSQLPPKSKPQVEELDVDQIRGILQPLCGPQESLKSTLQRILAQQTASAVSGQLSLHEIEDILRPVIQPQESLKDVLFRIMKSASGPLEDTAILEEMLHSANQQCQDLTRELEQVRQRCSMLEHASASASPSKALVIIVSIIDLVQKLGLALKEAQWREGQLSSISSLQADQLQDKDAQLKLVINELEQLKREDITHQLQMAERQLAIKDQIIQRLQSEANTKAVPTIPAAVVDPLSSDVAELSDTVDESDLLEILGLLAVAESERLQLEEELRILAKSCSRQP